MGIKPKQNGPETALEAVEGLDLSGKVFLVSGAYSGLGAATTKALLTAGANVIVAGRNPKSQQDFATALISKHGFDAKRIDATDKLDLGSLASVRDTAARIRAS
jgi:NAD(P)-dependent dehydrogenase (short-subunit alcohol dehydrogenase family)